MRNVDKAIAMSAIWVAFRPVDYISERDNVMLEPAIACKLLVRFDDDDGEPIYKTRFYNRNGEFLPPVIARRFQDGWHAFDPVDIITAMGDLLTRNLLIARSHRQVDRKAHWQIQVGQEKWLYNKALHAYLVMQRGRPLVLPDDYNARPKLLPVGVEPKEGEA